MYLYSALNDTLVASNENVGPFDIKGLPTLLNMTSVTADTHKSHSVAAYNFTFEVEDAINGEEVWIDWPSNFYQLFRDPPYPCAFEEQDVL